MPMACALLPRLKPSTPGLTGNTLVQGWGSHGITSFPISIPDSTVSSYRGDCGILYSAPEAVIQGVSAGCLKRPDKVSLEL